MRQASRRSFHFIYKTTCVVTGKFYVGMHSTDNIDDGYLGSGKILRNSIRKYGEKNHKREIIERLLSRESLYEREKKIVNEELLKNSLCMNIIEGGGGPSSFRTGVCLSYEHRMKISTALIGKNKGKRRSLELRQAIAFRLLGNKQAVGKRSSISCENIRKGIAAAKARKKCNNEIS